ncbi:hypothetical protein POM88_040664 [Heracleum sosnowskyi]|uniref:Uncharacterized protein n=1 Tax=Heracleum sosnowskyi TaxID=360622 RepID=A0AAD8MAK1_9APIA|nr:hypothetical protein POM88_040664 [Heracleum sosnowskyi]
MDEKEQNVATVSKKKRGRVSVYCLILFILAIPTLNCLCLLAADGSQVEIDLFVSTANNSTHNSSTISFDLNLYEHAQILGICYDEIILKFFYVDNTSMTLMANYTIPGFYMQGQYFDKDASHWWTTGSVAAPGISLKQDSTNVLRVYLETAIRFKTLGFIKSKKPTFSEQGDLQVTDVLKEIYLELHRLHDGELYLSLLLLSKFSLNCLYMLTCCKPISGGDRIVRKHYQQSCTISFDLFLYEHAEILGICYHDIIFKS